MNISMILRFIHVVVTGDAAKLGCFKLRGVNAQFTAAVGLYRLIIERDGCIEENELIWSIHDLLVALYRPTGLGNRAVDCPTDQMVFIWAFLGSDRYRIALHLNSLMAGLKYGFRCIATHDARVQAVAQTKDSSRFSFYDGLVFEDGEDLVDGDEELQENIDEDSIQLTTETIILQSTKMSKFSILEKLQAMKSIGMSYLICSGNPRAESAC